jgi:hypothetical protein
MKILISGSSGLVGSELISFLEHQGHDTTSLIRSQSKKPSRSSIQADLINGEINADELEGFDAIIHLAGENIAGKRWTDTQKNKIRDSRVKSTETLANAIAKLKNPPKVFICASAIGFYGDRPDEYIHEDSVPIKGDFLSETCVAWENACKPVSDSGIRTINTRFGVILSPKGGMLAKIMPIFQMGGGGVIGNGKQIMSWIAIDDVVYALNYILHNESIKGPVNFTAPQTVSNQEFTKILGKVLKRPTVFPVPSFAAKLAFGEMADALLLSSTKVKPQKLIKNGYEFAFPELGNALRHMLGHGS